MSVPWNPNIPAIEGLEWNTLRSGFEPLDSQGDCIAQTFRSTVAQAIGTMQIFGIALPQSNGVLMEIFTAGSEVSTGVTTVNLLPTSQANVGAGVTSNCSPFYLCLDGTSGTVFAPNGQGLDVGYTTGGLTGRILSIDFDLQIVGTGTTSVSLVRVSDSNVKPLGDYAASGIDPLLFPITVPLTKVRIGEINPFTDQPWTTAEAQGLDGSIYRLRLKANTSGNNQGWRLARMVTQRATENRLARSLVVPAVGAFGLWVSFPATKPDGTANWSKAVNTDYTVAVRHPLGGFVTSGDISRFALAWLDSGVIPPYGKSAWAPTITQQFDGISFNVASILSMNKPLTRGYAVAPTVTGSAVSVDAQPYAGPFVAPVNLFQSIIQEITVSGGPTTVGAVSLIMRPTGTTPVPDAVFAGSLRNNTGGTTHATYAIDLEEWRRAPLDSRADVNAKGIPWKRLVVPLSTTFTLVNATQYRVYGNSFAITGTGENNWEVLELGIGGLAASGVVATYNGSTDGGYLNSVKNTGDFPIQLMTMAPTVTGASAEARMAPAGGSGAEYPEDTFTICGEAPGMAGIPYIAVIWSPTNLGVKFAYYEVQRKDDRGIVDWEVIGRFSSKDLLGANQEGATEFYDYEARLNTLSSYRIRVVRTDGSIGAWSSTVSATLTVESSAEGPFGFYTFTSNRDPTLNLLYIDVYEGEEASRDYTVLDANQTAYEGEFMRDYWIEQRSTEKRGVRFNRTLLINAIQLPLINKRGLDKYVAIRRLQTQTTAPYITVRNNDGERFYASVLVPDVSIRQPSNLYFATISVTELTETPIPEVNAL